MHWVWWEQLCAPKKPGGLGFREMVPFSLALLEKQVWQMLVNPDSLAACALKARYFARGDVLIAGLGYNLSFIYRTLITGRELLLKGLGWTISHGERVRIWKDK